MTSLSHFKVWSVQKQKEYSNLHLVDQDDHRDVPAHLLECLQEEGEALRRLVCHECELCHLAQSGGRVVVEQSVQLVIGALYSEGVIKLDDSWFSSVICLPHLHCANSEHPDFAVRKPYDVDVSSLVLYHLQQLGQLFVVHWCPHNVLDLLTDLV